VNPTSLFHLALFGADDAVDGSRGADWLTMLFPFLAIGLLFYWLLIRPQRQEQARRRAMLAALKKNDRVVTAGGIYGVVTDVDRDANRVTVKVDEANNTKLRVTLNSVSVLSEAEASGDASK
jgi:preprotein translocase subunit YajC